MQWFLIVHRIFVARSFVPFVLLPFLFFFFFFFFFSAVPLAMVI